MPDKPKILIVDDEPHMCESLKELLSGNNYEIHTSHDGREATEQLSRMNVDIVLLDIVLPGMDGFKVMEHIKDRGLNTIVIVMTGNASVESAIEALRKGAYDYLRKPFEFDELLKTIKNALEQKDLESDLNLAKNDITESEERFRSIIENTDAGYFFIDRDGIIKGVNDSYVKLYGYSSKEEIIGQHFTLIQKVDDI